MNLPLELAIIPFENEKKSKMFARLKLYLRDLRREFNRINWPRQGEAFRMSVVVIVISLIVAAFLGLLDFIFATILQKLVT